MNKKQKAYKELACDLKGDTACEKFVRVKKGKVVNVGLVNQFAKHDFIPNKWFDWGRRLDSKIVVIGQDWGPYIALRKIIDAYHEEKEKSTFNYDNFLYSTFSSRTEQFINRALRETYKKYFGKDMNPKVWNEIMFTMAVLFTRQGRHFRGSEYFDENQSYEHSYSYVSRQLSIVKPKVVVALGNLAIRVVDRHYLLGLEKTSIGKISSELKKGYWKKKNTVIIPAYHPASHVGSGKKMRPWKLIWGNMD